ncbi:MAG: hypothetical protein NC133_04485 [Prevotella sp.]|nr:hypothetical protein [Prevotella sp.]
MKIKKIIISVACLLLVTALAVAGSFGYVTVKASNDAKMQEQYNAEYNASVEDQAAELELLGVKITDLQNQLAKVGDPAIAALVENVGAAVESGNDDAVDMLTTEYLEQGGSQTVVEMLKTLVGFANEYAALQAELDEMTKLNEEMVANSIAESVKFNNQIKELNATIAELQAQIDELQNSGSGDGYPDIENGDQVVVTFEVGDKVYDVKIVNKGETVTVPDPEYSDMTFLGWTIYNNAIDLNDYVFTKNTTVVAKINYIGTAETMTWNGLTDIVGNCVWSDGNSYYHSNGTDQYVLDVETQTWEIMNWNGLSNFFGRYVWTDGNNYYYSANSDQYVLDVKTHTWSVMNWSGLTKPHCGFIWTDGINYYHTNGSEHYVLDVDTHTWAKMTWNGLTSFQVSGIWTDGNDYYYSSSSMHYVLDISTHTWRVITWNGLSSFTGNMIWTDGNRLYYSSGVNHYVLDVETYTWFAINWNGLRNFQGENVWTDGVNYYFSYQGFNYVFQKNS